MDAGSDRDRDMYFLVTSTLFSPMPHFPWSPQQFLIIVWPTRWVALWCCLDTTLATQTKPREALQRINTADLKTLCWNCNNHCKTNKISLPQQF